MLTRLVAPALFAAAWVLSSCAAAPQATRSVPHGSAAFASLDEAWQKDLIRSVPPIYPYNDRAAWREGAGVFHLALDPAGSVRQVTVTRSTGQWSLDKAAIAALKQWRFKPGSWKSLDIPVAFKMASHAGYYDEVRKAQQQGRQL